MKKAIFKLLPAASIFLPASCGANTPEALKQSAARIKARMDELNLPNAFVTINAWNEWIEGSYLEADTKNGMEYLEAIREVFGVEKRENSHEAILA